MTETSQAAACPNDSSSTSSQKAGVSLPLFPLGQVLATPGALELLQTYQLSPLSFIQRHVVGDWGDICAEDRQVNADALQYGYRLMSVYAITPLMARSNSPTLGHPKFPQAGPPDYDDSGATAMRAAASLRR